MSIFKRPLEISQLGNTTEVTQYNTEFNSLPFSYWPRNITTHFVKIPFTLVNAPFFFAFLFLFFLFFFLCKGSLRDLIQGDLISTLYPSDFLHQCTRKRRDFSKKVATSARYMRRTCHHPSTRKQTKRSNFTVRCRRGIVFHKTRSPMQTKIALVMEAEKSKIF